MDVLVPDGATKMLVVWFRLTGDPTVYTLTYKNNLEDNVNTNTVNITTNTTKINNIIEETPYITIDSTYISFNKNGTTFEVTVPYRFYLHYIQSISSVQKYFDSSVTSGTISFTVATGQYLVYDLIDNTTKIWAWGDIVNASKNSYLLFMYNNRGNIDGGLLLPYYNKNEILSFTKENVIKTLSLLRESALGITFDTNVIDFNWNTNNGLDITLPYRGYIFGDKINNIYEIRFSNSDIEDGKFTISLNSGYMILDLVSKEIISNLTWA